MSYKNNKLKIPALTWNEEFQLPDGSYSVSDILEYFEYILKKSRGKINHKNYPFNNNICKRNKKYKYVKNKIRIFSWIFYSWNNQITSKH